MILIVITNILCTRNYYKIVENAVFQTIKDPNIVMKYIHFKLFTTCLFITNKDLMLIKILIKKV